MILVIQQGGSSREMYAHLFDRLRQATMFKELCANEGAYGTSDPIKVPRRLAKAMLADPKLEAAVWDLVDSAADAAARLV